MKQKGFTLIEVMIVLAIIAFAATLWFRLQGERITADMAEDAGRWIGEYKNGVRSFVAQNPSGLTLPATFSDPAYLRDSSCTPNPGTADDAFVPCSFPDAPRHGNLSYETVIEEGPGGDGFVVTTTFSEYEVRGELRPDMAGLAASSALRNIGGGVGGAAGMSTFGQVSANDPDLGVIIAEVQTVASTDEWLRVDGSNEMMADLGFDTGNPPQWDINNVNTVDAVRIEAAEDVIVGGNVEVDGDVISQQDIVAVGDMEAGGSGYFGEDVDASGDVLAGADVSAGGGVDAQDNIETQSDFRGENLILTGNGTSRVDTTAQRTLWLNDGGGDVRIAQGAGDRVDILGELVASETATFESQANFESGVYMDEFYDPDMNIAEFMSPYQTMWTMEVQHGATVTPPSCPGNSDPLPYLIPSFVQMDTHPMYTGTAVDFYVDDSGGPWNVIMVTYDFDTGGWKPSTSYAILEARCVL